MISGEQSPPQGRILIIDDDPTQLQTTSRWLRQAGHEVFEAATCREGLSLAREAQPELVLLDAMLPGEGSLTLCRDFETDPALSRTMIVLMSGRDIEPGAWAEGLEDQADCYMTVPLSKHLLLTRVRTSLRLLRSEAMLQTQTRELQERVKELGCLYGLANLVETPGIMLPQILQGAVDLIPSAWQYPEITAARLRLEEQVYQTENFVPSPWRQANPIRLEGGQTGELEVCYLEERPARDEGPFLAEERALLETIGRRLGRAIERLRANDALQKSQTRLQLLTASTPAYIYEIDASGAITFANRTYPSLRPEQVVGTSLDSWFPEELRPRIRALLERAFATGERQAIEYTIPDPEGAMRSWAAEVLAIATNGQPELAVFTATEITARKRFEEALREANERLEATLDALPYLLFEVDRSGRFLSYHARSREQLYFAPSDFLGRTLREVLPEEAAAIIGGAISHAAATGQRSDVVYPLEQAGKKLWFQLSLAARGNPQSPKARFLGLVHEITRRVEAEEALAQAHDELEQRVKARTAELEKEMYKRQLVREALVRSNRALKVLGECHKAVAHSEDEPGLLHQVCQTLVGAGMYRLAWVGYAQADEAKTVRPVAQAGYEDGYLETLDLTWADSERGRGPTGVAIRGGRPVVAWNIQVDPAFAPWREQAARRGYASSISLPVQVEGQCLGTLSIYASEPDAFDHKEIDLLTELAESLAHGIASLRGRAERDRAEQALATQARELARSNFFLSALNQVSARIQTTFEPQDVLETLGAEFEEMGLTCTVALLDPEDETLSVHYTSLSAEALKRAESLFGFSLSEARLPLAAWPGIGAPGGPEVEYVADRWSAARALSPRSASDHEVEGILQSLDLPPDEPEIHLPMVVEGGLIGVLSVAGPGLTSDDLEPLSAFANQVASAFSRARLAQQVAEAQVSQEVEGLRSELIANVSHEIRTPLGLIEIFATSLLMDDVEFDADTQRQFLEGIHEETERLAAMAENLLKLGRLEGDGLHLDLQPTDLGRLAREVAEDMEAQLTGQILACELEPGSLEAEVDGLQVEQVLRNLIGNAIKYSPQGGTVAIEGGLAGQEIVLVVSDEGIGIPAYEQDRIFERFYRADNESTREAGGAGLGLAVCRGIVEAHGGRVWVESAPGEGSRFYFTLPVKASR